MQKTEVLSTWVGKIPWRRKWLPLQYLGNPMDRGTWQAAVHGVTEELVMTETK